MPIGARKVGDGCRTLLATVSHGASSTSSSRMSAHWRASAAAQKRGFGLGVRGSARGEIARPHRRARSESLDVGPRRGQRERRIGLRRLQRLRELRNARGRIVTDGVDEDAVRVGAGLRAIAG